MDPQSSMVRRGIMALRQWLQPLEFRIEEPVFPPEWWATLGNLAEHPLLPSEPSDQKERLRFLADLATGLWRLRLKMLEPGTQKPKEQFRREYRHLEAVWDLLADAGLRVQDHTGDAFDPGQALGVAGRVPVAGLTRERVQETIKPTIYYQGEHIQRGVVLVESPEPPP